MWIEGGLKPKSFWFGEVIDFETVEKGEEWMLNRDRFGFDLKGIAANVEGDKVIEFREY